ncbi:MAG: hypothetical protein U9P10_10560, partial [Thermodesulfobacteriota bacterium]|nr:hypothetical protein [Thermodesulfobacteriota bacterium]
RFAHEMNIYQYAWGGKPSEYGPDSPRRYREMFRCVVLRFKNMGILHITSKVLYTLLGKTPVK